MSEVEKLIRLGSVLAESEDCDLSEIGDDISNLAHFWKKEIEQLRQKLEAAEAEVLRLDDECHVFSDECEKYKAACAQLSKDNVELRETIREALEQKPEFYAYVCDKLPEKFHVWRDKAPAGAVHGWSEFLLYKKPYQLTKSNLRQLFEDMQIASGSQRCDLEIEHGEYSFSPIQKQWEYFIAGNNSSPVPAMPYQHDVAHDQIIKLIESVRKYGLEHTGCEPSVSGFHCAVDELRMALENPQAVPVRLSDDEIQEIRNRAKLNENRQIDPMSFARDIERAVIAKAMPIPKQQPAGAVPDHVIAKTINDLRDVAVKYHGAQQLREQIASIIRPLLKSSPRITEQDARKIIYSFSDNCSQGNFRDWYEAKGRALLNKLNANAVAEVRKEPVSVEDVVNRVADFVECQIPISEKNIHLGMAIRAALKYSDYFSGFYPVPSQAAAIPEVVRERIKMLFDSINGDAYLGETEERHLVSQINEWLSEAPKPEGE